MSIQCVISLVMYGYIWNVLIYTENRCGRRRGHRARRTGRSCWRCLSQGLCNDGGVQSSQISPLSCSSLPPAHRNEAWTIKKEDRVNWPWNIIQSPFAMETKVWWFAISSWASYSLSPELPCKRIGNSGMSKFHFVIYVWLPKLKSVLFTNERFGIYAGSVTRWFVRARALRPHSKACHTQNTGRAHSPVQSDETQTPSFWWSADYKSISLLWQTVSWQKSARLHCMYSSYDQDFQFRSQQPGSRRTIGIRQSCLLFHNADQRTKESWNHLMRFREVLPPFRPSKRYIPTVFVYNSCSTVLGWCRDM